MLASRTRQLAEGLPGPFWALLAGTFVTRAGAFVGPMFFVYLTQVRGLPLTTAGTVVALFGAGSLLGVLAGGVLADRVGRRATMIGSLLLGAAFMLLLGASTALEVMAVSAFVLGLAGDAYRPASQAMVADLVPHEHRVKAFGLQYWAINLGFAVAAALGGWMAARDFRLLFLGDAATTLLMAAVIARAVPETRPEAAPAGTAPGTLLTPLKDRAYAAFLGLSLGGKVLFFQHQTGMPEDMRGNGLTSADFGSAIATNGLFIVVLQPLLLRWLAGAPRGPVLALAAVLTGTGLALTGFATTWTGYVLAVLVWTCGEILFAPTEASIVADLAPKHLRGRYQGAYGLTWSAGLASAPLIGPFVIARGGTDALWAACLVAGIALGAAHLAVTTRLPARVAA